MSVLQVCDLTKIFTNGNVDATVLNSISFDVAAGEYVAIMGQSGSGKSTLLYNVSGMDRLTSGQVLLNGNDIATLSDDELAAIRLRQMGFVFQSNHLLDHLTIIDNVCLPGFKARRIPPKDVIQEAKILLASMGILEVANHAIQHVSGGQLQRAAICRALINQPTILYADEPTGALNSQASQGVIAIFNRLNQSGMTILTVTHDPKVAASTDRIIYLKDGQISGELTLGKLNHDPDPNSRDQKTNAWLMAKGF